MTDSIVDSDLKRRLLPSDRRLFLSYAWLDEEVPTVDRSAQGWVRYLYDQVRIALRHRLGGDVQFWRDKQDIDENRLFEPLIDEGVDGAMLLLAVVSPGYLNSKWCAYERQRFMARQGHVPDGIERLVKVLKHRVAEEVLPPELQRRQGYRFFALEPETGREVPFFFNGKLRRESEYMDVVERLTDYLVERLLAAGSPAIGAVGRRPNPAAQTGPKLFLAMAQGEDTSEAALRVRCALETAGLTVLSPPTSVASEMEARKAV